MHLHEKIKWIVLFTEVEVHLTADELFQWIFIVVFIIYVVLLCLLDLFYWSLFMVIFDVSFLVLIVSNDIFWRNNCFLLFCHEISVHHEFDHVDLSGFVPFSELFAQLSNFWHCDGSISLLLFDNLLDCALNPFRHFRNELFFVQLNLLEFNQVVGLDESLFFSMGWLVWFKVLFCYLNPLRLLVGFEGRNLLLTWRFISKGWRYHWLFMAMGLRRIICATCSTDVLFKRLRSDYTRSSWRMFCFYLFWTWIRRFYVISIDNFLSLRIRYSFLHLFDLVIGDFIIFTYLGSSTNFLPNFFLRHCFYILLRYFLDFLNLRLWFFVLITFYQLLLLL